MTWFYRKDYSKVAMTINVFRAFTSMLSVAVVIHVVQKHYLLASLRRVRRQMASEVPYICNC